MIRSSATVVLVVAVVAAIGFAVSRGPDPNEVPTPESVWERVMSPYCEGLTLAECPSSKSAELRADIGVKVAAGWSNSQIDSWLVDNFGETVLGKPRSPLSWMVPIAALTLGAAGLALLTGRKRNQAIVGSTYEITDEDRRKLQADLQNFAQDVSE